LANVNGPAPTAVNEGEIAVASNEELPAARISGEQLLALCNAMPNVEKRREAGDRDALIDQLYRGSILGRSRSTRS
jgi:hypothetical protein